MLTSPLDGIATGASNYEKYKDLFTDDRNDLTMDSFYKLLVAEMSNQDPLEPTSNTEFISQLASFSAMQAQQDNFALQKQNYANSLVGQTVTVQGSVKDDLITGVVESVNYGDETMIVVNGKSYKLSAIKQFHGNTGAVGDTTVGGTNTSLGNYGAFAASILGKTVMVQATDENGEIVLDRGTVDSLEIENGDVRVIVNGYAYDVTEIVQVTDDSGILTKLPVDEDYDEEEIASAVTTGSTAVQTTETTETDNTTAAELAGSNVDRTDDADIPDLVEDDDETGIEAVQPENPETTTTTTEQGNGDGTWVSEQEPWVTEQEASELYSLFGEN
ncbi:MAG: hypothetical protein NC084_11530 [Bacteroides sp.]|nr:hypothetical protein [Eubacterium sp.]MCM1419462.1 hypothetical protein [Roseburia sp.]MCM1463322.1 hypothetical protein [Bacteroides sp.]